MVTKKIVYFCVLCLIGGSLFSATEKNEYNKFSEKKFGFVFVQAPLLKKTNNVSRLLDSCKIVRTSFSSAETVKKTTSLTGRFFSAMDPEVSFDGKKILFTGKKKESDFWQIWEMDIEGKNKIQITFGKNNHFSPIYTGTIFNLNDKKPTKRIAYIVQNINEYAIYTADINGKNQKRITYNLSKITEIDIFKNGRIIYNSIEQFSNNSLYKKTDLLAVNIDGTDNMGYLTNNVIGSYKRMPKFSTDRRVYFIENKTNSFFGGKLSYVLEKRPLHSYKVLNPKEKGYFYSVFPTIEGNLIASYKTTEKGLYSIYYLDKNTGNKKKIYASDKYNCIDVQLISSRPVVRGRATFVSYKQKTGVFYCISSHISQEKIIKDLSKGAIKKVNIYEGFYSKSGKKINTRMLGQAPVEKDGSFHIEVPSEIPLSFQLIGQNGKSLSKQVSWTWVMPRESRGCIGCHEDRELAPPNHLSDAIIKPAYIIKRKK